MRSLGYSSSGRYDFHTEFVHNFNLDQYNGPIFSLKKNELPINLELSIQSI